MIYFKTHGLASPIKRIMLLYTALCLLPFVVLGSIDGIDTGKVIKHGDDSAGICCKIAVTLEGEESTGILHEIHINPYMRMVTTAEIVRNFSKSVNFKQSKEQNEDPSKNQLLAIYRLLEQMRIDHIMGTDFNNNRSSDRTFMYVANEGQGKVIPTFFAEELDYREVMDPYIHRIFFTWVTWPRQAASFEYFHPGLSIINSIEGIARLDRKDYMQHAIETYASTQSCANSDHPRSFCLKPETFFPPTYAINTYEGCKSWYQKSNDETSSVWLFKPPDKFAGTGFKFVKPIRKVENASGSVDFHDCSSSSSRLIGTKKEGETKNVS